MKRSDFFTDMGTVVRCGKGHPSSGMGPFCPQDGTPFNTVLSERMTEALAAWGARQGYDDPWDGLRDTYRRKGLGLFSSDPIQSSESTDKTLALGYRLMEVEDYKTNANRTDVEAVNQSAKKLVAEAKELGIEGTPQLFLCLYWSV